MIPSWEFLLILLATLGLAWVGYLIVTAIIAARQKKEGPFDLYLEGLEALVSGERERAFGLLRQAARLRSDVLGPFLILGDLLRGQGRVRRALKVHRELSMRPHLDSTTRQRVWKSLLLDLLEARRFREAIAIGESLLKEARHDRFTLEKLLYAYEEEGRWDQAVETARTLARQAGGESFLAGYLAYVGRRVAAFSPRQARKYLKEALALNPRCSSASLYLGDLYFQEGDIEGAVEIWEELLEAAPQDFVPCLRRLEKAYFERGDYGRMVEVYERLLQRYPKEGDLLVGLARILHKKGDTEAARRLLQQALDVDPENPLTYVTLLEMAEDQGAIRRAHRAVQEFLERLAVQTPEYRCSACGHPSLEPGFRCPRCHALASEPCLVPASRTEEVPSFSRPQPFEPLA